MSVGRGLFSDFAEFASSKQGIHLAVGWFGIIAISILSLRPITTRTEKILGLCIAFYAVFSVVVAVRQKDVELVGLGVANLAATASMARFWFAGISGLA